MSQQFNGTDTPTIETEPDISRQQLSIRFCRQTNWRKPDGGLKDMSCRVAFLKMDKDGHVRLPPPKKLMPNPAPGKHVQHIAYSRNRLSSQPVS